METAMMSNNRLNRAIEKFEEIHKEDPNREVFEGQEYPKELLYHRKLARWMDRMVPDASEELQLAIRSQHIRRWTMPMSDYPKGRDGYKQWRKDTALMHAKTAAGVLEEVGYDAAVIEQVSNMIRKKNLKVDSDSQHLQDIVCVVFLESHLSDFAAGIKDEEKLIKILRKTWALMGSLGHKTALELDFPEHVKETVVKAIS
jgi:hypothetical protein